MYFVFIFLCIATEGVLRVYAFFANTASVDFCEFNKFNKADAHGFYRFSSDPDLILELKPGFQKSVGEEDVNDFGTPAIRINQAGLREDREYAIPKPPDTFRIAVIGSSATFGWGIRVQSTWPKILEVFLKKYWPQNEHVEVINFSVPSYNGKQELALLETKVPAYDPDLVIVGWANDNDMLPSYLPIFTNAIGRFLNTRSYIFACFRQTTLNHINVLNDVPAMERYRENGSGQKISKEVFAEMASFSRKKNIPIIVAMLPVWQAPEKNASDGYTAANQLLEGLAESSGLTAFDMLPKIENLVNSSGKPMEYYRNISSDVWHPNTGNALITQAIYNYLVDNKFVPIERHMQINPAFSDAAN